jgi:hypothetical protein
LRKRDDRNSTKLNTTMSKTSSQSSYLDYFARPGDGGILREAITDVRAAWYGPELASRKPEWRTQLSTRESNQLRDVIREAASNEEDDLSAITATDLKLPPIFESLLLKLKEELAGVNGLGVHVVSGIPVEEWTSKEQQFFFWVLGQHIGRPAVQDADGLLLQHIRDTGADARTERQYKTNAAILPHTDAADVVGLLCINEAKSGGASRIVSSVTVYNEFVKQHSQDMVERLYQPFPLDLRSKTTSSLPVTPVRYSGDGQLRTFYHAEYYQTAYRHASVGQIPDFDAQVLEAYNIIASDPKLYLDMEFRRGDIQFLSNHTILHARAAYTDNADPDPQRHLLRLWLALDETRLNETWRQTLSRQLESVALVSRVVWGKMRFKLTSR